MNGSWVMQLWLPETFELIYLLNKDFCKTKILKSTFWPYETFQKLLKLTIRREKWDKDTFHPYNICMENPKPKF
jgi:hypothetical protein